MALIPSTTDIVKDIIRKKKKKPEEEVSAVNTKPEAKIPPATQPIVIRDEKGRAGGLKMPDGKVYVGLKPDEVEQMMGAYNKKTATPEGAIEGQAVAQQKARQRMVQNIGQLTAQEISQMQQEAEEFVQPGFLPGNINLGQAATAGAAEALTGTVTGAATGAITGAVAGAGVGAIPGAVVGAAAGTLGFFIKGAYSDIKQQQAGLVTAETANVRSALTQLNNIVSAVNQGEDPADAILSYNQVVANTYKAWSELKLQTTGNAKAFSDGTVELERFQIFFQPGGTLDTINAKMAQAVVNPNPNKVEASTVEAFLNDETE